MKRVYVAGAINDNNIIGCLDNIREGLRWSTKVLLAGMSPFCPFYDFHFQLMLRDGENLNVDDYYNFSLAWLEVSDAVFVTPDWEKSKGVNLEIDKARELNIPIYYDFEDLLRFK